MGFRLRICEGVAPIVHAIRFQDFQPMWSWSTNVTDRETDERHANLKTALCTIVHRAASKLTAWETIIRLNNWWYSCDTTRYVNCKVRLHQVHRTKKIRMVVTGKDHSLLTCCLQGVCYLPWVERNTQNVSKQLLDSAVSHTNDTTHKIISKIGCVLWTIT